MFQNSLGRVRQATIDVENYILYETMTLIVGNHEISNTHGLPAKAEKLLEIFILK